MTFNKIQIHLLLSAIIVAVFFVNKLYLFAVYEHATGTIVDYQRKGSENCPIIEFMKDNHKIRFVYRSFHDYAYNEDLGKTLKIIYKKSKPTNIYVLCLGDFWLAHIFFTVFPLIIINGIVFSFLHPKILLRIKWNNPTKIKKGQSLVEIKRIR